MNCYHCSEIRVNSSSSPSSDGTVTGLVRPVIIIDVEETHEETPVMTVVMQTLYRMQRDDLEHTTSAHHYSMVTAFR